MRKSPPPIRDLFLRQGVHLLLLLAVLVSIGKSDAQEQIYGSGDFILNAGQVVSDTGTVIGSTGTQTGGSYLLELYQRYKGSPIPVSNDQLPHSINATAVNGTVTKSPDQAVYDFNTRVILTAKPDPGYIFEKWTLDVEKMPRNESHTVQYANADLRGSSILLKAVFNYEMVAHFIPASRIITVSAVDLSWDQQAVGWTSCGSFRITNTGNAPLTVASIDYPTGFNGSWAGTIAPGLAQEITVNFAPTAAGTFSGSITVNSDATAGTFTIPVSAVSQDAYSLTGTSSFGALRTLPATRTYWQGSIVTLKAMPVAGYVFMNWTEDQEILSTNANFDLPIAQQHQVWANYLPESRTLMVSVNHGSGLKKVGSMYRGTLSIKNTGTLPIYVSDVRLQGKGTGRILASGNLSGWIKPNSTLEVKISFKPTWGKFYQLRVLPMAQDLSSPVKWVDLSK